MDKEPKFVTDSLLIADVLLRLKALENLLVAKGVITEVEFKEELGIVSRVIMKEILAKARVPGNLDEIVDNLQSIKPEIV